VEWDLGIFYYVLAMFILTGVINSVNLTDGLDGLASSVTLLVGVFFAAVGFWNGMAEPDGGMVLLGAIMMGACGGFLVYNFYPARVFMGDTGSLSLGALLGTIAILAKQDLLLAIIGFVFVAEALSVMIQVFWYKRTKTRVFLMAPIHHHFEQKGWKETTVVIRFWVIGWLVAGLGMLAVVSPTAWGN
jgi:phospho-N-acetylmuramoyl-pentapeptide-transferase